MSSGPDLSSCTPIPARAGVGLKAQHYQHILTKTPDVGFFEVHAENYMGAGGPPHRYLASIRDLYSLSLHGVGLSIGGTQPLDKDHLKRLAELIRRYRPGLFSEHLAWSTHETGFLNDLLPTPYTAETLARISKTCPRVTRAGAWMSDKAMGGSAFHAGGERDDDVDALAPERAVAQLGHGQHLL